MTPDDIERIEDLFHRAKALEPADRGDFLDVECRDDLDLRAEVESLLAHADRQTRAVDLRADVTELPMPDRGQLSEGPGTRIGAYKILQQIGEGGFGVVYMAQQERPVQRKVALKIIKLGMDTKQVIARFEAERQALAMMDHPNIARVLDGGATETGRPYFVMELVKGITLTDYCDKNRLSTPERLRLFCDVCRAVQHAHQKGIIHRDLKPSNVLVTLHDANPVPKVIDFGIAKATSHRLTEKTLFTEYRQLIGTPEYMSPDQAEISGLDVDTRSDIYSLGVLLYELLTSTTPFDAQTLRSASYADIQRIILEEEPPRPSTRLDTLGVSQNGDSSIDAIARLRHTDAHSLSRSVRGDLDWIVMKAMEKDRTRRYQTATDFAADIDRFLANEPVLAGPPSVTYKLRKFIRRHRVGVLAASLVVLAVLCGLSLSMVGFVKAHRETRRSQAISAFLQEHLVTVDPQQSARLEKRVESVLAESRRLFGDDHAIVAGILYSWAANLRTVGHPEEAAAALEEALTLYRTAYGDEHPSVAAALGTLADVLADQREYVRAEEVGRQALALVRRIHGRGSLEVANALDRLTTNVREGDTGERADEIATLWSQALDAYRSAVGEDDRRTVTQLCKFATWLALENRLDEAEPLLVEAVERGREVLGRSDHGYFEALGQLVRLKAVQATPAETKATFDELILAVDEIYGPDHRMAVLARANYGGWLFVINDHAAAEPILIEACDIAARTLPVGNPHRVQAYDTLTKIYVSRNDFEKARPLYRTVLEEVRVAYGESSLLFIQARSRHGRWLAGRVHDEAAALPVLREVVALAAAHLDSPDMQVAEARATLIGLLEDDPDGDPAELRELHLRLIGDLEAIEQIPERFRRERLADAARWLGDNGYAADAEPAARELLLLCRQLSPPDEEAVAAALIELGDVLTDLERPDEAEPLLRECLEIRTRLLEPGHWLVGSVTGSLGACLTIQTRFEEAEPLLERAYAMMRDSPLTPEKVLERTRARLVDLYAAWGRPEDAARWR